MASARVSVNQGLRQLFFAGAREEDGFARPVRLGGVLLGRVVDIMRGQTGKRHCRFPVLRVLRVALFRGRGRYCLQSLEVRDSPLWWRGGGMLLLDGSGML